MSASRDEPSSEYVASPKSLLVTACLPMIPSRDYDLGSAMQIKGTAAPTNRDGETKQAVLESAAGASPR